jgi:hypothetical protein
MLYRQPTPANATFNAQVYGHTLGRGIHTAAERVHSRSSLVQVQGEQGEYSERKRLLNRG